MLRSRGNVAGDAALTHLSMYADAPSEEVTLEDFEFWAFERLKGAC